MYRLRGIWLACKSHIGRYVYAWLMYTVIIVILSTEVASMERTYNSTFFIDEYDEGTYMYANVLSDVLKEMSIDVTMHQLCTDLFEEISKIGGVKGIGYDIALLGYDIQNGDGKGDINYINDVLDDITYKAIDGQWLTEAEYSEDYVNVVLSGDMKGYYRIGDTFIIENKTSNVSHVCKVVGIFYEAVGPLSLNVGGSDKILTPSSYEWRIYTNDKRVLDNVDTSTWGYPSTNLIITLDEDCDKDKLLTYGNLYSLEYMENANDDYFDFVWRIAINNYGILVFVVLFGSFSIIYLIVSKGMYATGVYALLGQTKVSKIIENVVIHLIVYISALIASYIIHINSIDESLVELWGGVAWTDWNTVFAIILGVVTTFITVVTTSVMIQNKPKDIITAARNMEE